MAFGIKTKQAAPRASIPTPDTCPPMSVLAFRSTMDKAIAAEAVNASIADSLFPTHLKKNPLLQNMTLRRVLGVAMVELKDIDLAFNFFLRFLAMQGVIGLPAMATWMPESNEKIAALHPAVFEALASHPMKPTGGFDADSFFAKVAELAAEIEANAELGSKPEERVPA